MYYATRNALRKFSASASGKATAVGTALMVPVLARAQSTDTADIVQQITGGLVDAKQLAVAVVAGIFAIFAVKLLLKAK